MQMDQATMVLNQILDSEEDEFWIWMLWGFEIHKGLTPFSNNPQTVEIWVGDEKGPCMQKIPHVMGADVSKPIFRKAQMIHAEGQDKDRLSYLLAENLKEVEDGEKRGVYLWPLSGVCLNCDRGVSVRMGANNRDLYRLDIKKCLADFRTANFASWQKSDGNSVMAVGSYPDWADSVSIPQLKGHQAIGTDSSFDSPSEAMFSMDTFDRFLGGEEECGFMLLGNNSGPWFAIMTSDVQFSDLGDATTNAAGERTKKATACYFIDEYSVYCRASLERIKAPEVGKLMAELFWKMYGRETFHFPVPVAEEHMERWTPETALALNEIIRDPEFDIVKTLNALGHYSGKNEKGEIVNSNQQYVIYDNKDVQREMNQLNSYHQDKKAQMNLLLSALKSVGKNGMKNWREEAQKSQLKRLQAPVRFTNQY